MDDRDGQGRFLAGWKGGPGRPRRNTEVDYLLALTDALPLDRWREICAVAIEQALAGDAKARAWLSDYLIGPQPGDRLHRAVFAGEIGEFRIDADGCVVHTFDPTEELLDSLTTTERFEPNGSKP
jgi:hypothetical protein